MISFGFTGAPAAPVSKNSPAHLGGRPRSLRAGWERAVLLFLGLCALLFALPAPAMAFDPSRQNSEPLFGGPQLKIIYTAETKGETQPCFYWGSNTNGGLARRAGFIERERQDGVPTLLILGPGEFWADEQRQPLTDSERKRGLINPDDFLRAYDRFMAQGIYVSSAAQKWLGERASTLPPNYIRMQGAPQSRIIPVAGRRVGIVYFAPGGEKAQAEAMQAGRELRGQVDLLMGVSPWGSELERAFADRVEGLYHIILGGGPGYGFGSALKGKNLGVLWLRPEPEGSAVNMVEILAWPDPALHIWEYAANFTARVQLLGPNVPEDKVIMEIFK